MEDNLTSIANNKGELFYVGDVVTFSNNFTQGKHTIMKIYIYHGNYSAFPCWKSNDGRGYISDNLVLVERPEASGWQTI